MASAVARSHGLRRERGAGATGGRIQHGNNRRGIWQVRRKRKRCEARGAGARGDAAKPLGEIQKAYPSVVIGSYPFQAPDGFATNLVLRSRDEATLEQAYGDVCRMAQELTEQGKARGWS